jgi:PAS domain S-box-containing protein
MKQKFINLKLRTKLLIGFSLITLLSVVNAINTKITLSDLREVEGDVATVESLKSGISDVKFLVAHDLKLLMELITTDNSTDLESFWQQHEVVRKEYDKVYEPILKTFNSDVWDDNYLSRVAKTKKLLSFVHDYRTSTLVPVLRNVHELRLKQLETARKGGENAIVSISKIQQDIDKQDDNADSKAEEVFAQIDEIENLLQQLTQIATEEQAHVSNVADFKNYAIIGISLLFAILITSLLSKYIVNNINFVREKIEVLGKGILPEKLEVKSEDEVGQISGSINNLIQGLTDTSSFAGEIGKGEFETEFNPLSSDDVLGNSLLDMRTNLLKVAEDEKKRNWATEGLAKFGDILRANDQKLEDLADSIVSNLVRYLNANQGGLFIVNDHNPSDKYLELIACYAWNKKKYLHMRIEEGEGLVGQAWQENDTLYITDVPHDYVKITSGLGDANPKSFLIVPLTVNDETFGVIEIASFNMFEQHEIDFVNKLAESIASTLSTAKTNDRTRMLLEQSQQQAEEMRAQEEEMRQNMEEMAATQEEMERKELQMTEMIGKMREQEETMRQNMEEMEATQEQMEYQSKVMAEKNAESQGVLEGINATMATIEFTPDGHVKDANANFLKTMKTTLADIHGKHHSGFVPDEIKNTIEYKTFWSDLAAGHEKQGEFKRLNALGEVVWLNAIYNPIKDASGNVIKVVKFATDITESKAKEQEVIQMLEEARAQEEEIRQNMEEMQAIQEEMEKVSLEMQAQTNIINSIAIVSKTDLQGNITYVNEEFLKWSKYTKEEVMGKNHRMLKSGDQDDQIFVDMWKTISAGKIFRGEIKNKAKDGSFYWVDAIIAPVLGEDGKPKEYLAQRFVINEIIEQKERDALTKKTYEGEINSMYEKWYNQLKRMEQFVKSKN